MWASRWIAGIAPIRSSLGNSVAMKMTTLPRRRSGNDAVLQPRPLSVMPTSVSYVRICSQVCRRSRFQSMAFQARSRCASKMIMAAFRNRMSEGRSGYLRNHGDGFQGKNRRRTTNRSVLKTSHRANIYTDRRYRIANSAGRRAIRIGRLGMIRTSVYLDARADYGDKASHFENGAENMPHLEFVVLGPPISAQTTNKLALKDWKTKVKAEAAKIWTGAPLAGNLKF